MDSDYIFDLGGNKILAYHENAVKLKKGDITGPKMAIIYPVYGCNNKCVGCEYADDNRQEKMLDFDRMLRLLEELYASGTRAVEFCGGGEPTLYPHLDEIVLHGRKLGLSFGLLTNGSNLSGQLAEVAVREMSYIRISINAATPEKYSHIHRPLSNISLDTVTSNIASLISARDRTGGHLLISIKMLVSSLNYTDIPAMFDIARDLGVDSLQFKALRMNSAEVSSELADEISGIIARTGEKHPDVRVIAGVGKTDAQHKCWLNPLQTVIDAYGDVFLCCYFRHRKGTHTIGNINDCDFRELWGSPAHRKAIESISVAECNRFDCRFVGYMKTFDTIFADTSRQMDFF